MNILDDQREITAVNYDEQNYIVIGTKVGIHTVTSMKIYGQGGMHCDIPWIAIYCGDQIIKRVNAQLIHSIDYKIEAKP